MMTSIVMLISNVEYQDMRSSKLIIKGDAHNQIIEFGFKRRFHDLKFFKVG